MTVERLSEDLLHYIAATDSRHEFSLDHVRSIATELLQLRAAKAADKERVREAVQRIVHQEFTGKFDNDDIINADWMEIQRAIASRVADAIAVPGQAALTADERTELREILAERWMDDYAAGRSAIERLLIDLAPAQIGLSDSDRKLIGRALEFMSNYYHDVDRDQIAQIWRRLSR